MLHEGQFACPGDKVIFTCEIEDSDVLAWASDQLIGQGGEQIQFSVQDSVGLSRSSTSNPNTFANLTVANNENGTIRLVSDLHIIVPSIFSNLSISCISVIAASTKTRTFTVLGMLIIINCNYSYYAGTKFYFQVNLLYLKTYLLLNLNAIKIRAILNV